MNEFPKNLGRRFGDISILPEALLEKLTTFKIDSLQSDILSVLNKDLDGIGSIDEIMIALYNKNEKIEDRRSVSSRLYKLTHKNKLEKVKGKKGVYRVI